jgi:hypothetical protein
VYHWMTRHRQTIAAELIECDEQHVHDAQT